MQDPSKQLGEASCETLGQMCNVLLTNPDPRCCDSLVVREDAEKRCTVFPGEGLQTLLYISLPSVSGFTVALLLFKPGKL